MSDSCDPMDCGPPGSSVHGISQARILEWVAMSSPGDLPHPGIEPMSLMSPALAGSFSTTSALTLFSSSPFGLKNSEFSLYVLLLYAYLLL